MNQSECRRPSGGDYASQLRHQLSMQAQRGYDPRISTARIVFGGLRRLLNRLVADVPLDVEEEKIGRVAVLVAVTTARRSETINPGHVHAELLEGGDCPSERPSLVGQANHQGGLIAAGPLLGAVGDTANRVTLWVVLDVFGQQVQAIRGAGGRLATAAAKFSRWASSAAAAVETTSTLAASGRFLPSQFGTDSPSTSNKPAGRGPSRTGPGDSDEPSAALPPGY